MSVIWNSAVRIWTLCQRLVLAMPIHQRHDVTTRLHHQPIREHFCAQGGASMRTKLLSKTIRIFILVGLVAVVLATLISTRASGREQSKPTPASEQISNGEYADTEACIVCHA